MPIRYLSATERDRLRRFPREISQEDLITFFTLSDDDLEKVQKRRRDSNRLGFALQLCALRYLGFFPEDPRLAPPEAVAYVAEQIGVSSGALSGYGARGHTTADHQREIQSYLGYRRMTAEDLERLSIWLVERSQEHHRPTLLLQILSEKLHTEQVMRPGLSRLERMVANARREAEVEIYRGLACQLSADQLQSLDSLLVQDEHLGVYPLTWLRRGATANSPRAILETLKRLAYIRQWEIEDWDLSSINPNRLRSLAQVGRRATAQALQRTPPERRYPILVAFLRRTQEDLIDEVIEQVDRCLGQAYARSRRDLEEFHRQTARATSQTIRTFQLIAEVLLDPAVSDRQVRSAVYGAIPPQRLRETVETSSRILRPPDDHYFDFLARRYSYIRHFSPVFLEALDFRSNYQDDPLLAAVQLLQRLNRKHKRKIPEDAPQEFVPGRWRRYVVRRDGSIHRRYYELCTLWELRNALRSGDIWVAGSRRYADPETFLIPRKRWLSLRAEVRSLLGVPEDGAKRLHERQVELETQLAQLDAELSRHPNISIQDGRLVLSPFSAIEGPESTQRLQRQIDERLPDVELADLLIEVDRWTHFSHHFQHAAGSQARSEDLHRFLYATILAQACNLGLSTMAALAGLSSRRLAWYANWYVRDETLRAATNELVNFQYRQPLGQFWGGGTLSSSDGQRFPVSVQTRIGTALPRYFGYGRGLTFYTWTSDQFSQYGTKVIPSTVRDATYVLDEILDNETELPIVEHTTDTTGYTDLVFGLFDLLGLQFSPRLRDIGEQRLYRLGPPNRYRRLRPLLKEKVNQKLILKHWDDLLRIAGSLKQGWVTTSLLIGKLQANPQRNHLARALQEYGRIAKTIFILRYLRSESYRRRIGQQLNKGEALHALRRFSTLDKRICPT